MLHSAPLNETYATGFEGSSMNSTVILPSILNVHLFQISLKSMAHLVIPQVLETYFPQRGQGENLSHSNGVNNGV